MAAVRLSDKASLRLIPEITEQSRGSFRFDKPKPKTSVELATVVRAATGKTGDGPPNPLHPRKRRPAMWAFIKKSPGPLADGKWQSVTTRFAIDAQIAASFVPFGPMRRNSASSCARLREQMRQFMAQGLFDLPAAVFAQARIQRNQLVSIIGAPGATLQARIPLHTHLAGGSHSAVSS
jgi:hypothetical protein